MIAFGDSISICATTPKTSIDETPVLPELLKKCFPGLTAYSPITPKSDSSSLQREPSSSFWEWSFSLIPSCLLWETFSSWGKVSGVGVIRRGFPFIFGFMRSLAFFNPFEKSQVVQLISRDN